MSADPTYVLASGEDGRSVLVTIDPVDARTGRRRITVQGGPTFYVGPRQLATFASALAPDLTDACPEAEWVGEDQAWRVTDCAPASQAPDYDAMPGAYVEWIRDSDNQTVATYLDDDGQVSLTGGAMNAIHGTSFPRESQHSMSLQRLSARLADLGYRRRPPLATSPTWPTSTGRTVRMDSSGAWRYVPDGD